MTLRKKTTPVRALSVILTAMQVLPASMIARRAAAADARPDGPLPATSTLASVPQPPLPRVTPNRTAPRVSPPEAVPTFSARPTDAEIFDAHVFEEPLVPVGSGSTAAENKALAAALTAYARRTSADDVGPLLAFRRQFPRSAWSAALLLNLGLTYRRTGYFSLALDSFEATWALSRHQSGSREHAVADRALAELGELLARLGRTDRLDTLFSEIADREVRGSAGEVLIRIREARWVMANDPGVSFRCGPYALARIFAFLHPDTREPQALADARSSSHGTSLVQVSELATSVGLPLQMARRREGAPVPTPALVHWKAGHFAAVLEETTADRYRVEDPTFGTEFSVTRAALDQEASGFFLVPAGPLPDGWEPVARETAGTVWGKGYATWIEPQTPDEPHTPCKKPRPMADYRMSLLNIGLNVYDAPVGYDPPVGPSARFRVDYNQRDSFQPGTFTYSNLGPKWTFGWLSYILEDDTSNATVKFYARGGGQSTYTGLSDNSSDVHPRNQTILIRTSTSPIRYERLSPDGSKEVFSAAVGTPPARKVFLTQLVDPQGNTLTFTFDGSMRLTSATDSIGQVTQISYGAADPLKITKVTDPFGRSATFDYDASGRLARITDVIGITSDFTYGSGTLADFITAMKTPYGVTSFRTFTGIDANGGIPRWLEVTDPMGARELLEFSQDGFPIVTPFDPLDCRPEGIQGESHYAARNTFYWDKRAMAAMGAGHPVRPSNSPQGILDYQKARNYHWPHGAGQANAVAVLISERTPLQQRVWYRYPGQDPFTSKYEGTAATPILIARKFHPPGTNCLDADPNQPVQAYRYEYNAVGKIIKATDPVGRETRYTYGTGTVADPDPASGQGIDLLKVEQKTGASTYATLSSSTYDGKHRPLTTTDAAGQTTTYTYNAAGQILTVTTPPRAGINEDRTTTYEYDANGYLQSVARPMAGAVTRYSYDGYGRVATTTDPDGYALVYEYDALDRVTRTTYPDNTTTETVYNRLDEERQKDRLGRWTQTVHDALRRPTLMRDALGRTTRQEWCNCGSLDKLIDGNGNATSWIRDIEGRVVAETRADGKTWAYGYEYATGRLQTRTDPKGQVTTYEYFLDDKVKRVSYAGASVPTPAVNYVYDSYFDRLTATQVGTDPATSFTYYGITAAPPTLGAGRLSVVNGPLANDDVSYTYDELGRTASRGLAAFVTSFSYDSLGRLSSEPTPVGTFTYTYDGTTNRPLTLTYPNGQLTQYTYSPNSSDHRLQRIKHLAPAGSTVSQYDYTYSAVGDILTWTQQVGTGTPKTYSYEYDAADQLISAKHIGPPPLPVPGRYAYAYDPAGNRIAEQQDNNVIGATFNNRNQLVSRQPGGALLFRGTLNEPGTVTVQTTPAQVAPNNAFVAQAPVPPTAGNVSVVAKDYSNNTRTNVYQVQTNTGTTVNYTYDFNGNVTSDGTRTYDWDAENRLAAVKQGPTTLASFAYDAQGRRSQKSTGSSTTAFVYDSDELLEARSSLSGSTRYVQGTEVDQHWATIDGSGNTSYVLSDHLRSVVQTTSTTGTVVSSREYDPYGNLLTGTTQSGYAYTGREWDGEVLLYFYRARYLDPGNGRFISPDPLGLAAGPNEYLYVENDPVNLTDPLGLLAQSDRRVPRPPSPKPPTPSPRPSPSLTPAPPPGSPGPALKLNDLCAPDRLVSWAVGPNPFASRSAWVNWKNDFIDACNAAQPPGQSYYATCPPTPRVNPHAPGANTLCNCCCSCK